jgi:hypothetical protein
MRTLGQISLLAIALALWGLLQWFLGGLLYSTLWHWLDERFGFGEARAVKAVLRYGPSMLPPALLIALAAWLYGWGNPPAQPEPAKQAAAPTGQGGKGGNATAIGNNSIAVGGPGGGAGSGGNGGEGGSGNAVGDKAKVYEGEGGQAGQPDGSGGRGGRAGGGVDIAKLLAQAPTENRDPDSFYQFGKVVATVSGAQPDMPNSRIIFAKILESENANPSRDFEYRDWLLRCVDGGRNLPSPEPPPDVVAGHILGPAAFGWSCTIVGPRK